LNTSNVEAANQERGRCIGTPPTECECTPSVATD
jgi:hypothetical protein